MHMICFTNLIKPFFNANVFWVGRASPPIQTKSKNVILFSLACHKCWNNFWNVCWQTKFMTKNINKSETCFMFSLPRDVLIFQENKKININWENVSFCRRSPFPRLEGYAGIWMKIWTKKSPPPTTMMKQSVWSVCQY